MGGPGVWLGVGTVSPAPSAGLLGQDGGSSFSDSSAAGPKVGEAGPGLAPNKPIWFSSLAGLQGARPIPTQPGSFQDTLQAQPGPTHWPRGRRS